MKNFLMAIVAILCVATAEAQMVKDSTWSIENYDWDPEPKAEKRDFITQEEEAIIQQTQLIQIRYEKEGAAMYELVHKRIWVGSESVIQRYNKLYLPLDESNAAQRIKARVLLPNGTVNTLDDKDIQQGKDEEGREYNYFALNGVQAGSIVEYLFLTQEEPSFMGSRMTLQTDAPIYDLKFELVTPSILVYRVKSYNALNQPEVDTTLAFQSRLYIHQEKLEKFKTEPASYDRAYKGYLIFALQDNLYSGKRNISDFKYVSANIYSNIHIPLDKKAKKEFKKIIQESGIAKVKDERLKLATLENYLKENYFVSEFDSDELYNLESILETHAMSEFGALRLYHLLYEFAGFPNELVFTSNKALTPFDPEFENNLYLAESFLYFPRNDEYIMPSNMTSRLGYFAANLRNTPALFIEGLDLGEGLVGVSDVREIPPQSAKENNAELMVNWHLNGEGDLGEIIMERKTWGLQSNSFQTISKFVQEDEVENFRKAIIDWMYGESELEEYEVINLNGADFPAKPLIVKARFNDEVYTEPGSSSTVIKVGEVIGPQSEMYLTDSVRHLPVHHGFPKWYHRVIRLHVPEGYVLKNVESLKMLVKSEEDKPLMMFKSDYKMTNNVLEVTVDEWYEIGDYPANQFETYRQVINAAADFNKKYVVLEEE